MNNEIKIDANTWRLRTSYPATAILEVEFQDAFFNIVEDAEGLKSALENIPFSKRNQAHPFHFIKRHELEFFAPHYPSRTILQYVECNMAFLASKRLLEVLEKYGLEKSDAYVEETIWEGLGVLRDQDFDAERYLLQKTVSRDFPKIKSIIFENGHENIHLNLSEKEKERIFSPFSKREVKKLALAFSISEEEAKKIVITLSSEVGKNLEDMLFSPVSALFQNKGQSEESFIRREERWQRHDIDHLFKNNGRVKNGFDFLFKKERRRISASEFCENIFQIPKRFISKEKWTAENSLLPMIKVLNMS